MKKYLFTIAFLLAVAPAGAQALDEPRIDWPAGFAPQESKFFVHNEIEVQAAPEIVWAYLVDALKWESWYEGAKNVSLANPADLTLQAASVFHWQTMGLKFASSIREYEPSRLLVWESRKKSIQGIHAWLIIPTASGCKVITEESQNGWLTFFEKTFQGKKLKRLHDVWLAALKQQSESHRPS